MKQRARALLSSSVVAVAVVMLTFSGCGSRTGLFAPDPTAPVDASFDGAPPTPELDGAIPCIPGRFDFELATPQIMFVLDRSGSMAFALDGTDPPPPGRPSRWQLLRTALSETIVPFDAQVAMGAKFFPEPLTNEEDTDSQRACRTDVGIGIAPARGNANSILNVFDTTSPRGGTPTAEAIRLAAQALTERRTVGRTIVLATDGAPNCNPDLDARICVCTTPRLNCAANPDRGRYSCLDDKRAVTTVQNVAEGLKIPVYVIGIGSTERPDFLAVLDQMAVAGGRPRPTTPRHYNVQTASEMKDALVSIRDSVAKCTYLTPSSPLDPNAITVEIGGGLVKRDPSRANGWDWVDQAYGELAFFGPACDLAQAGTPTVTGVVSCEKGD